MSPYYYATVPIVYSYRDVTLLSLCFAVLNTAFYMPDTFFSTGYIILF